MNHQQQLPWQIQRIISVANDLQTTGNIAASSGEHIAAAFVLNRIEYLPATDRDVVDAWERLGNWQAYVKQIKRDYLHLIEGH